MLQTLTVAAFARRAGERTCSRRTGRVTGRVRPFSPSCRSGRLRDRAGPVGDGCERRGVRDARGAACDVLSGDERGDVRVAVAEPGEALEPERRRVPLPDPEPLCSTTAVDVFPGMSRAMFDTLRASICVPYWKPSGTAELSSIAETSLSLSVRSTVGPASDGEVGRLDW